MYDHQRAKGRAVPTQLRAEVGRVGFTLSTFAHVLGVSVDTASRWACGKTHPEPVVRARVNAWLGAQGIDPAIAWAPMPTAPPVRTSRPRTSTPRRKAPHTQEEIVPTITTREFLASSELSHFGLAEDPFDDAQDPTDVFLGPAHAALEHAFWTTAKRRRIVALVGDPGSGKSTMLRRFYATAEAKLRRVRLITLASLDRAKVGHTALAVAILRDLLDRDTSSMPQETRSELLRATLADQDAAGVNPVLLIEEAHLLRPAALVALKQIWDSHLLFHQIAVVLVGQLSLRDRLRHDPAVRELAGRCQVLEVPPLGDDVGGYLRWRFARVGGDADKVFEAGAYRALAAKGEHPLWVNNLAVLSMRYAAGVGHAQVLAAHVARA